MYDTVDGTEYKDVRDEGKKNRNRKTERKKKDKACGHTEETCLCQRRGALEQLAVVGS